MLSIFKKKKQTKKKQYFTSLSIIIRSKEFDDLLLLYKVNSGHCPKTQNADESLVEHGPPSEQCLGS